ncbi:MAG: 4a-hydroxytetrahydrobiopterin dehydratase [Chloroflexi bacterium]|nr:4a-hydroxytetrahydrobiopterin dehydratase [Chloroflexota bacterium]MDL1941472.1 4a-hydroxytetrahydrobiopterin dehydratase [Chloroflexi bacterium CFX2]
MTDLASDKCIPCRKGDPALTDAEIAELLPHVPEWQLVEVDGIKRLQRVFKLKNYVEAVAFTNKTAMTAEKEDHHPLIVLEWGRVTVQWWTHAVGGLHKNDFIMAAKTDALFGS